MDELQSVNATTVCISHSHARFKGIFYGDNPLLFSAELLLVQLSIAAFLDALFQNFLSPLGQTSFVSQILVGIVIGPSCMGRIQSFRTFVFPPQSFYVADTFAFFGVVLFLFVVGVKTDLGIMRRPGKRAVAIGLSTFLLPLILNLICALTLSKLMPMNPPLHKNLYWIASLESLSNFHVIACFLADLKLLNTELGRLAISSSMVNGFCSWCLVTFFFTVRQTHLMGKRSSSIFLVYLGVLVLMAVVCLVLRPIMFWMVRNTPSEQAIRESYVFWVFIMVLWVSMLGEFIGQHFLFGPMLLGLAVPNGPPLGSALVTKLDSFVSHILLPLYFVISGSRIDFGMIQAKTVGVVQLLALLAFMWKLVGAILPAALLMQMPLNESLYLGLIMTSQGIIDVLIFSQGTQLMLIDRETYSIMVLSAVAYTAIVSPIVKFLYKPAQTYTTYKRTIQHSRPYGELRMLACIHQEDHTPSVINLLEASYPNPENPICMYVVHLIDLAGRSASVLEAHLPSKKKTPQSHESYHIINAFHLYEQQKKHISVFSFTARSPYATMHEDVCVLAVEKRVSVVILPFYTLNTIHAGPNDMGNMIRSVNKNILKHAPCSVGILIDRGSLNPRLSSEKCYNIGVLFICGRDDREALSLGRRMAKNPDTSITVVHLVEPSKTEHTYGHHDLDMINDFQHDANNRSKKCWYQKEIVNDSVDVVNVIRSVENTFDIILVGRTQPNSRPLLEGLSDWNEFPELGFMGDMLCSSDAKCRISVLVVQQQAFGGDVALEDAAVINISSMVTIF